MPQYAIVTHQLTRTFGNQVAVNNLDLKVPRAGVYCFLGPNGAGKTTTIRMLLGLLKPDSGDMQLIGQFASGRDIRFKKRMGSLVESPSYYPHLTGRKNLEIVRQMRGANSASVNAALAIVNLSTDASRRVKTYSLGMKQRLAIAMALLGEPELLILDEPTNGLDPAGILEIRSLIKHLAHEAGLTIFVSSHLLSEVEQIADTIGIINQGNLIFQGARTDLQAEFSSTAFVELDQPDQGVQLLKQYGWPATLSDEAINIATGSKSDLAMIIRQLVSGGYTVFQAGLKVPSLEDIFLQKVASEAQVGGRK